MWRVVPKSKIVNSFNRWSWLVWNDFRNIALASLLILTISWLLSYYCQASLAFDFLSLSHSTCTAKSLLYFTFISTFFICVSMALNPLGLLLLNKYQQLGRVCPLISYARHLRFFNLLEDVSLVKLIPALFWLRDKLFPFPF